MVITARGSIRLWGSLVLMGVYAAYLICNVVYLQRQESRLNIMRENDRRLHFIEEFKTKGTITKDQIKAFMMKSTKTPKNTKNTPTEGKDEETQSSRQNLTLNTRGSDLTTPLLADGGDSGQRLSGKGTNYGSTAHGGDDFDCDDFDRHVDCDDEDADPGPTNPCDSHTTIAIYQSKADQVEEESRFIDLDVINVVDLNQELEHHHNSSQLHNQFSHHPDFSSSSTLPTPVPNFSAEIPGHLEDGEKEIDYTRYMGGISWPNPEWDGETSIVKLIVSKILWIITFPFSLSKWLSIPGTECRPDFLTGIKKVLFFTAPLFLSIFLLFLNTDGFTTIPSDPHNPLLIALPASGLMLTIFLAVFYFYGVVPALKRFYDKREELRRETEQAKTSAQLTTQELAHLAHVHLKYDLDIDDCYAKPGIMSVYQILVALVAFVSSIAWLSFFADEIVNILSSFGLMFGISSTILGIVVVSIGNSLPDLVSAMAFGAKGKIGISYAAIFGAPVLSSTFGLGIATLLKFLQNGETKVLEFAVGKQLWLCFGVAIAAICCHIIVFSCTRFSPPRGYGAVLVVAYSAFLLTAVLFEILL